MKRKDGRSVKSIFLFFGLISSCLANHTGVLKRIEEGDFSSVHLGHYPFVKRVPVLEKKLIPFQVLDMAKKIGGKKDILGRISLFFTGIEARNFEFYQIFHDKEKDLWIITFFSPPLEKNPLYAGVMLEWVTNPKGEIKEIYVRKVPFERRR